MRISPAKRTEPSLEERLSDLDAQLRAFEASLRSQQQSHTRVRGLELELAAVVERGAALVQDLSAIRDEVQRVAETAAREAATPAAAQLEAFDARGKRLLDAYADAVRAAQQAVARAEARIDAFDERVGRELAHAGKEIHEAAQLLRQGPPKDSAASGASGVRLLVPALLAAALLVFAVGAFFWGTRAVRDASSRADSAERQVAEVRRDANQQIASIRQNAEQISDRAGHAERIASIVAAPDLQRMGMQSYGKATNAAGQALWSPSHGLTIVAAHLPPLSVAETYQVWLVTAGDSVSLGTIAPDASGRITGVFDVPAGLGSVRGFMITREGAGGAPRPSSAVVLAT